MSTDNRVERWTSQLVLYERTKLPADHPRFVRFMPYLLDAVQEGAARAHGHMLSAGILPTDDTLRALAEDGVDLVKHRAEEAARSELADLRERVVAASFTATREALHAALDILEPKVPPEGADAS